MNTDTYAIERSPIAAYAVVVATLGGNIERLRMRHGFKKSRREFARLIGVEYQSIYDWEKDRRRTIDLQTALRLATGLRVTLDDLVSGVNVDYDAARGDLISHTSSAESGSTHETAAARIFELEQRLRHYEEAAQEIADRLIALAERSAEVRATARAAAPRGRRDRKAS